MSVCDVGRKGSDDTLCGNFVQSSGALLLNIYITEAHLDAFAQRLALACQLGSVLYLQGDLGSGKTRFARAMLHSLGWSGTVKSPTYSLVDSYQLPQLQAYHCDLYRLADPEELEFIGIRDLFDDAALWLIEWPERGQGMLPMADLQLRLHAGRADNERLLELNAQTERGRRQLAEVADTHQVSI